jgi:site-specific recombinase XerD
MNSTYLYWQNLKKDFLEHLEKDNVVRSCYFKEYGRSMDLLFEYALINDYTEYSPELGHDFWEYEKSKDYKGKSTIDRRRKAVKRLNEFLYDQTFWQRTPRNLRNHQSSYVPPECPEQFTEQFGEFLESLKREGLKEITIGMYRPFCIKHLLRDFDEQGIKNWRDINARTLTTAFSNCKNKVKFTTFAKRLFGYLQKEGVVKNDYSSILPMVTKRKTIPSVYSEAEIQQLLDSIETITPQGKRDYTIVLIAVRLGLRISDISRLCFENIDYARGIVKFVQFKTSVPHQLPLPDDVADSIRDYVDNGREKSDEPYIFLDGYGHPLTNQTVGHIGARHIDNSGIEIGARHHGMHALRMSFASQLIAEQMPYDVVRYALGHVDPNSTRHYVQFAIESLRVCSLEVPPPSGLFKQYLEGGM